MSAVQLNPVTLLYALEEIDAERQQAEAKEKEAKIATEKKPDDDQWQQDLSRRGDRQGTKDNTPVQVNATPNDVGGPVRNSDKSKQDINGFAGEGTGEVVNDKHFEKQKGVLRDSKQFSTVPEDDILQEDKASDMSFASHHNNTTTAATAAHHHDLSYRTTDNVPCQNVFRDLVIHAEEIRKPQRIESVKARTASCKSDVSRDSWASAVSHISDDEGGGIEHGKEIMHEMLFDLMVEETDVETAAEVKMLEAKDICVQEKVRFERMEAEKVECDEEAIAELTEKTEETEARETKIGEAEDFIEFSAKKLMRPVEALSDAIALRDEDRILEAACILRNLDTDVLSEEHHAILRKAEEMETIVEESRRSVEALSEAIALRDDDRLLEAARILRNLDPDVLSEEHHVILRKAGEMETIVHALHTKPDTSKHGKWTFVGENHTHGRDTLLYYKMESPTPGGKFSDNHPVLKVRIETPIEQSLMKPLISVMNETQLYKEWVPSWTAPRFGLRTVDKLKQIGRCSQILHLVAYLQWPMAPREVFACALAVDDIDTNQHIVVDFHSLEDGEEDDMAPSRNNGNVRMGFAGGFLLGKCPQDYRKGETTRKRFSLSRAPPPTPVQKDRILVSLDATIDATMPVVPKWLLNFLVRTVTTKMWNILLNVAEEVRDGKRPSHKAAIDSKREEVYDWLDLRVEKMFAEVDEEKEKGIETKRERTAAER